jgi:predicted dehydrogenase
LGELISIHGRSFNHLPVGWTVGTWLFHSSAVLYDFTPHLVDLILWLKKTPVYSVYAWGKNFTPDANFLSSAEILVTFKDKSVASLSTSWEINNPSFIIDLYGNGGRISLDLKRDYYEESHGGITPLYEARIFFGRLLNVIKGIIAGNVSNKPLQVYKDIFGKYLQSLNIGEDPPMTIRQGVRTNMVLEAAKLSINKGLPVEMVDVLRDCEASADDIDALL